MESVPPHILLSHLVAWLEHTLPLSWMASDDGEGERCLITACGAPFVSEDVIVAPMRKSIFEGDMIRHITEMDVPLFGVESSDLASMIHYLDGSVLAWRVHTGSAFSLELDEIFMREALNEEFTPTSAHQMMGHIESNRRRWLDERDMTDLHEQLSLCGLDAREREEVASWRRPLVWLEPESEPALCVDASRSWTGGAPMLPESTSWPMDDRGAPLTFIAQLNLDDLASLGFVQEGLPTHGSLAIFASVTSCVASASLLFFGEFVLARASSASVSLGHTRVICTVDTLSDRADSPPFLGGATMGRTLGE